MTHAEWLALNPLRQWCLAQAPPWRRNYLAQVLDVSRQSLSNWERGLHTPNDTSFDAIERLTGLTPPDWTAWMDQRPDAY
jgi:hypothetical protein